MDDVQGNGAYVTPEEWGEAATNRYHHDYKFHAKVHRAYQIVAHLHGDNADRGVIKHAIAIALNFPPPLDSILSAPTYEMPFDYKPDDEDAADSAPSVPADNNGDS